jgi:hypothetical protein
MGLGKAVIEATGVHSGNTPPELCRIFRVRDVFPGPVERRGECVARAEPAKASSQEYSRPEVVVSRVVSVGCKSSRRSALGFAIPFAD